MWRNYGILRELIIYTISPRRYLALKTALTCEADYVFVPEMPPPVDWTVDLERKIKIVRKISI